MSEKSRAARKQSWAKLRKALWPDLSTEQGYESALSCGWGMALLATASYAVVFLIGLIWGWVPGAESINGASLTANLVMDLCLVAAGLALAWFIWRRQSRIAVILVFAWIAAESLLKIAWVGAPGVAPGLIFTIVSLNGVRASFYKRRAANAGTFS